MFVAPFVGMTPTLSLACYMVMTKLGQAEMAASADDFGSADIPSAEIYKSADEDVGAPRQKPYPC
jgi:uncharacterized membrane protein YdcZ (DUF606 family)